MTRGLIGLIFVIMVIINIFLLFQLYDNSLTCKEARITEQSRITEASRLAIQSISQDHPLFALENALRAKFILEEVSRQHVNLSTAERQLKLPKGRLETLRDTVNQNVQDIESMIMEKVIGKYPQFNSELNDEARLTGRGSERRAKRKHRRKRHH